LVNPTTGDTWRSVESALPGALVDELQTVRILSAGFIVTSLLWSSALVSMIDRRLQRAALYCLIAGLCSLFGIIHSPLPGAPVFVPWGLVVEVRAIPFRFAVGYAGMALILGGWSLLVDMTDTETYEPREEDDGF
ncbi:MAG: hypothetical protein KDA60_07725, partial [Planctomycetales bacterium]|nr:hypothetical protein [Planctomycetales bacterium]